MTLDQTFSAYSDWRAQLSSGLESFRRCLSDSELSDAQTDLRLQLLLEKLREDRLQVAFVAEFSRGKSELINALFFADYGNRILPSTAGRTTMCPTELMYDPAKPPSIELLPIETRETNASVSEYKRFPEEWKTLPLDIRSASAMQQALHSVSEVAKVATQVAARLGFAHGGGDLAVAHQAPDGLVEIPRWRHAVINFPHPLLKQGLVILDTPGLNAIGTEPELTLALLPNAHAVLFVLAADTGVTQSDLAIWNDHIGATEGRKKGRLVILNKIDSLWDELLPEEKINAEIAKQAACCARTLDLPKHQIFPVSAQKALVAKINKDEALLKRSRIAELEAALSGELIPAKREIVFEATHGEFSDIYARTRGLLDSRLSGLREQLDELSELRGKNRSVVEYMMGKVHVEKKEFESGLQRYYAVRNVFSQLTNRLFTHLGIDALRTLTSATRATMLEASFSKTLSDAMKNFFNTSRANLRKSDGEISEILSMMDAIYKKFSVEHGLKLGTPHRFSLIRYQKEIDRLDAWCDAHLNTAFLLLTMEKNRVTQRFFEEVATQVRRAFERANRDAEAWLKAIMAPMETQVREHQIQQKRRLESIKRIHQATDTLEERITELVHVENDLSAQIVSLENAAQGVERLLDSVAQGELRDAA